MLVKAKEEKIRQQKLDERRKIEEQAIQESRRKKAQETEIEAKRKRQEEEPRHLLSTGKVQTFAQSRVNYGPFWLL